jgi:microcystin-dependent protein
MDESYISAIFMWPTPFAPSGYAYCNGASLNINQNQALYALIGAAFGVTGNPPTAFNLPDLRGRVVVGATSMGGAAMPWIKDKTPYNLAKTGGLEYVTITSLELPVHTHAAAGALSGSANTTLTGITASGTLKATTQEGNTSTPGTNAVPAKIPLLGGSSEQVFAYGAPDNLTTMPVNVTVTPPAGGLPVDLTKTTVGITVQNTGSGMPSANVQPFIALNYIIALQGIFPQRP